jgi:DNA-binding XRE family transcriptional regulator
MASLIKIIDTTGEPDTLGRLIDNYNMTAQLRNLRKQAGLTQAELATRAGVSPATVCNLENGKVNISLSKLEQIAKALKATVHVNIRPLV